MRISGPVVMDEVSIPEIPRITAGLVLAAGALGNLIGSGGFSGVTAPAFLIVAVSSIGLIVSGVMVRSSRLAEASRRSVDRFGAREFRREVIRARRRESPLALVRLSGARTVTRGRPEDRNRLRVVRRHLRRIDLSWLTHGDVYLLLPDTDADGAHVALDRLRKRAPAVFAEHEPRIAVFPDDGLTSAALVALVNDRPPLGPSRKGQPVSAELGVGRSSAAVPAPHDSHDPRKSRILPSSERLVMDQSLATADAHRRPGEHA